MKHYNFKTLTDNANPVRFIYKHMHTHACSLTENLLENDVQGRQ